MPDDSVAVSVVRCRDGQRGAENIRMVPAGPGVELENSPMRGQVILGALLGGQRGGEKELGILANRPIAAEGSPELSGRKWLATNDHPPGRLPVIDRRKGAERAGHGGHIVFVLRDLEAARDGRRVVIHGIEIASGPVVVAVELQDRKRSRLRRSSDRDNKTTAKDDAPKNEALHCGLSHDVAGVALKR